MMSNPLVWKKKNKDYPGQKEHSAEFKAKMAAIRGDQTVAKLAVEFGCIRTECMRWTPIVRQPEPLLKV